MTGTSSPLAISTRLQRIATLASEDPQRVLTTLAHHIDVPFLKEAYRRTRKDGAVGVDGQTAHFYAQHLEVNLTSLLHRFKSGTYYAPPVRRVYIISRRMRARQSARLAFLRLKIKCFNGQWPWYWRRSTSRTFSTARMGFDPNALRTKPLMLSGMTRCG